MKTIFTTLMLFTFSTIITSSLAQIYVDQNAQGANDGTSWADAYTDLQDALASTPTGGEILVAAGTYTPDAMNGSTIKRFTIDTNLKLTGGYQASTGDHNPSMYKTFLSGDLNGNDVPDTYNQGRFDNSKTIMHITSNVDSPTLIEGFTFKGGHANGSGVNISSNAGALYIEGSAIISNCNFENNFAGKFGGAIRVQSETTNEFVFDSCMFNTNWAEGGGALSVVANGDNILIEVKNCQVNDNSVLGNGGGINCIINGDSIHVNILESAFEGTSSVYQGGGLRFRVDGNASGSTIVVDDCHFDSNSVQMWTGGGLRALLLGVNTDLTVSNSTFTNNFADLGGGGAGIFGFDNNSSGNVDIQNCTFENNMGGYEAGLAWGSGTDAGFYEFKISNCDFLNNQASLFGGAMGIYSERPSRFLVEDCLLQGNTADSIAGGLLIVNTHPETEALILNTRIIENSSAAGAGVGGFPGSEDPQDFMFTSLADFTFENCLIANNSGESATIELYQIGTVSFLNSTIAGNLADGIRLDSSSAVTLQNTILFNDGMEYEGLADEVSIASMGGNLISDNTLISVENLGDQHEVTDPGFVGANDYRLQYPGSIAIGAGIQRDTYFGFDLDGNDRLVGCIDIGAYEHPDDSSTECLTNTDEIYAYKSIDLFPNPVVDHLQLDVSQEISGPIEINIFDTYGKTLQNQMIQPGQAIDVSRLVSGVYFLRVEVELDIYLAKFVKI